MRRFLLISLMLVLVSGLIFGGCAKPVPAPAKPIELSLATFFPPGHNNTILHETWAKEVEAATNGRVKTTMYAGASLLPPPETYQGVVKGVADIGVGLFAYNPGRFPVMEVFELPTLKYPTQMASTMTVTEGFKKLSPAETSDIKMLMFLATAGGCLLMREPVHSLEDLRGKEVRILAYPETMEALGAVPVAMPAGEIYGALEKGIVDGVLGAWELAVGWRLSEVTDYIIEIPFHNSNVFYTAMNLDVWNSIPPDLQKTIEKVSAEVMGEGMVTSNDYLFECREKAIKELGMEVIWLSSEEEARWLERLQPLADDWVAKVEAQGLPGKEILDTIIELNEKYAKQYPGPKLR